MIGGTDIILELPEGVSAIAMECAARYLMKKWPESVLQDANTGNCISMHGVEWSQISEIFVYKDEESKESWENLGWDATNMNKMLHIISEERQLTFVVDDLEEDEMNSVIGGLRNEIAANPAIRYRTIEDEMKWIEMAGLYRRTATGKQKSSRCLVDADKSHFPDRPPRLVQEERLSREATTSPTMAR